MRAKTLLAALAATAAAGGFGLTTLGLGAAVAAVTAVVPGVVIGAGGDGMSGTGTEATGPAAGVQAGPAPASPAALPPPAMLGLYVSAAAGTCPGLPWTVLAAVGTVESDNGLSRDPGVRSGANFAGAEGPMQFEPATFAEYALPVPPGGASPASPYDPVDAVWAAARMLCADGADHGDEAGALYAYNHSDAYVAEVLALAQAIGERAPSIDETGMPTS